jgi:predicted  nucleic acid-binding Zn-ribbon protein
MEIPPEVLDAMEIMNSQPRQLLQATRELCTLQENHRAVMVQLDTLQKGYALLQNSHDALERRNRTLEETIHQLQESAQQSNQMHASVLATLNDNCERLCHKQERDEATFAFARLQIEGTVLAVAVAQNGSAALDIMTHGMKQLSILLGRTQPVPDSHVDSSS